MTENVIVAEFKMRFFAVLVALVVACLMMVANVDGQGNRQIGRGGGGRGGDRQIGRGGGGDRQIGRGDRTIGRGNSGGGDRSIGRGWF